MDELDAFLDAKPAPLDDLDAFLDAKPQAPQKRELNPSDHQIHKQAGRAIAGLGGGLLKAGVGAIQGVSQLVGAEETAQAAGEVTKNINRNLEQLGGYGKTGAFVGEVAPYAALPAGGATLVGRTLLGGAGGALAGGLQAQEEADWEERQKAARIGGAIGVAVPLTLAGGSAAVSAAKSGIGGASKEIQAGMQARTGDALTDAVSNLKTQAKTTYKAAREAGATLTDDTASRLMGRVEQALTAEGKLHPKLHRDTLGALDDLKATIERGEVGLDDLDQARQILGRVVFDNTDAIKGANTDAQRAVVALEALDDFVEKLGAKGFRNGGEEATAMWGQARNQWKQYRQFETVANAIQKGDGDPVRIKRHLKTLLANKKRTRGFSPGLIKGLQDAANTSGTEALIKTLGSFGFDSTGVLRNIFAGGAVVAGGPVGYGLALAGTGARQLEKLIGRGKAENLLRLIEQSGTADDVARVVSQEAGSQASQALSVMLANMPDGEAKTLMQQAQERITRSAKSAGQAYKNSPLSKTDGFVTNPIGREELLEDIDIEALLKATERKPQKIAASDGSKVAQAMQRSDPERLRRAAEQGFDTSRVVYRGLSKAYDEVEAARRPYQMFTTSGEQAGEYADYGIRGGNVLPAFVRKGRNLTIDGGGRNFNVLPTSELPEAVRSALGSRANRPITSDELAFAAKEAGFDSVTVRNVFDNASNERRGTHVDVEMVFDPKNIRSVNAKFDPSQANSANILASRPEAGLAAVGLSGAGALGVTAGNIEGGRRATLADMNAQQADSDRATLNGMMNVPSEKRDELGDLIRSLPKAPVSDGVSPNILGKISKVESSNNPNAQAPTSSALGIVQYTSGTWLEDVEKYRPDLLKNHSKADVLRMRRDKDLALELAGKRIEAHAEALRKAGLPVNDASIYLTWFGGLNGAKKLLSASPDTPAVNVLGHAAVKANPKVLKGKKVADVIAWAEKKMS